MKVEELDVVTLKDGRAATVLEVYDGGKAFLVEIADKHGRTLDTPTVTQDDIANVAWRCSEHKE